MNISEQSESAANGNHGEIGNLSREQFNQLNVKGSAAVSSVIPELKTFTENDWQLFLQIAVGGTMQLELSRVAAEQASDEEVLALAQAEVEEQSGLSDKLKEFADQKNLALPSKPDEKTQEMVKRLQHLSGSEFDLAYIRTSGVMGHEKLDAVMSKVETEADDPDLLDLAAAARPLVLAHLEISRRVLEKFPA